MNYFGIQRVALQLALLSPALALPAALPAVQIQGGGPGTASGTSWVSAAMGSVTDISGIGHLNTISMIYYFEVDGPAAATLSVDVDYVFDTTASLTWTEPTFPNAGRSQSATTALLIQRFSTIVFKDSAESSRTVGKKTAKDTNQGLHHATVLVSENLPYGVTLTAFAGANYVPPATSASFAYADPRITISAASVRAFPDYSIRFSDGIDNVVTSVPEVPIQALLLSGLAVLFSLRHRSHRPADRRQA